MSKEKLPNPELDYTAPLELSLEEAALASHALRFYMNAKGYEVSRNTPELEAKLQSYIEHRLGPRKMTIELDEES
jgi:hypothetical protein